MSSIVYIEQQHILFGKRFRRMIKRSMEIHEEKSRNAFRKELRKVLGDMVRKKVRNKDLFEGTYYALSLVQTVIFDVLYLKKHNFNDEIEKIAQESLLIQIFEPEDRCVHFSVSDRIAIMLFEDLNEKTHSEKVTSLLNNFPQITRILREIIDKF